MKNRLLLLSVCSAMLLFFSATASAEVKNMMFDDMKPGDENYDAIYFLRNAGILEGYKSDEGAREYRPSNKINRAEFLKTVLEGTDRATNASYPQCFPDVPPDAWFATYVCQAKAEGVVNGYPDGTFRPDQTINEVESIKILGELDDWELRKKEESEEWYAPYLEEASLKNIIPENDFSALMDRGDIAEMIYRNMQVMLLDLIAFTEDLVNQMFAMYEIPNEGALAPGGLFGPGGPFGNTGAFGETGEFTPVEEDFFDNRYCYFSDEGDFWERVVEILSGVDTTGYDADGFGIMFCHDDPVVTDLTYFDDWWRSQYNVNCWHLPERPAADQSYEEVLCYVEQEVLEPWEVSEGRVDTTLPYCVNDSDGCYTCFENILSNNIVSQKCPVENGDDIEGRYNKVDNIIISALDFKAGGSTPLKIEFLNEFGDAIVPAEMPKIKVSTGRDFIQYLPITVTSDGAFTAVFSSQKSGSFIVSATDAASGVKGNNAIYVDPGPLAEAKIMDVNYDYENGRPDRAIIKFAGVDKYDNLLPYSSVSNNLSAATTMGSVAVTHDEKGIFTAELTASNWGVSNVTIMNGSASMGAKTQVTFFPIQLDFPKAVEENAGQFAVPMYIYFPKNMGELGEFSFKLLPKNMLLKFIDIEDPAPSDAFGTPLVQVNTTNGMLTLQGLVKANAADVPEIVPIGTLLFEATVVGDGSIRVADAVLKNSEGQTQNYIEFYSGMLGGAADSMNDSLEEFSLEFWKWWYKVKPWKSVCVDVFIFEGSDATELSVSTDIVNAMQIFSKNAQKCNCNFYLDISVHSVTQLTAADMKAADSNGDGDIDLDLELDNLVKNHPGSANCIPVYYVPLIDDDTMGVSWDDDTSGVAVDESTDWDSRTLAHELSHQLSKNKNVDQPHHDAGTQGADQPGNLMHYDDTGDNLTPAQCAEIEKNLP